MRAIVARVIEQQLGAMLTSTKRDEKTQASLLLDKVVAEMRARITARKQKEISRRKNALETSSLPSKLADCRSDDVERSELFIVEGDSALGTAKLARSSDFQALLPIRGKILNVQKASVTDMLRNAECAAIIQVIGAGSGRSFDLEGARYGKVVLMTDADVDGAHIRTLLLTLFFRYMRPLVDAGRVYAAVPPLHRVEVIGAGSRKNEYIYTYLRPSCATSSRSSTSRASATRRTSSATRVSGDGRRPARGDHHGPAPPHAASCHRRACRGRRARVRAPHGFGRRAAQGLHHRGGSGPGPGADRRVTSRLLGTRRPVVGSFVDFTV